MKKTVSLLLIFIISACDSTTSIVKETNPEEEIVLTKEEQVSRLYAESVVPLFNDFEDINIPASFHIDKEDSGVNAGAAFGYVEVSRGFLNLENEPIQIFVLAHEISHIATLSQARAFGLEGELPAGTITNHYRKAEYLADLIAIHFIKNKLPEDFSALESDFGFLKDLLGSADFTHPSGSDRIASLNRYLIDGVEQNDQLAFRKRFIAIWEMK